jgi:HAMP domain-containing protein
VLQEARILSETALAIRGYTKSEIEPLLRPMIKEQFLPHVVPAFAAEYNFRTLEAKFPEYSYEEAALNPTNLNNKAEAWEATIITTFREQPELTEQLVSRDKPNGQVLTLAHPIHIKDEACLQCHSEPSAAPASMLALYGPENGFGWKLGDIIGAQLVSVPANVPEKRAWRHFWLSMGMITGVFATIVIALNVALHVIVLHPIKRISHVMDEFSMRHLDTPEYVHNTRDEIGLLSESFNRMRRSLSSAIKMLEGS